MASDIWMQFLPTNMAPSSVHAKTQRSLVKFAMTGASDYADVNPITIIVGVNPDTLVPTLTGGMLFKSMSRHKATARLQDVLSSVKAHLETELASEGMFADQCRRVHKRAQAGKVHSDVSTPALDQMLEFCQRCLGAKGEISLKSTPLMGSYSNITMPTAFGFDAIVAVVSPQDMVTKELALEVGSNRFQNVKVCWR